MIPKQRKSLPHATLGLRDSVTSQNIAFAYLWGANNISERKEASMSVNASVAWDSPAGPPCAHTIGRSYWELLGPEKKKSDAGVRLTAFAYGLPA